MIGSVLAGSGVDDIEVMIVKVISFPEYEGTLELPERDKMCSTRTGLDKCKRAVR